MLLALASAMKTCWLQVLSLNPAGINDLVLALNKLQGTKFIKVLDREVGLPHSHMTWERHPHMTCHELGDTHDSSTCSVPDTQSLL